MNICSYIEVKLKKTNQIQEETFKNLKSRLLNDESLFELSDFFKVFGDSTRIKILQALSLAKLCVYDLSLIINSSQSAVSHQLRILRTSRLVKHEKKGRTVFYSLNDDHIEKILKMGIDHISEKGESHV